MVVKSLGSTRLLPVLLFISASQHLSCTGPPISGWKVADVSSPFVWARVLGKKVLEIGGTTQTSTTVGREWPGSFSLWRMLPFPSQSNLSCPLETKTHLMRVWFGTKSCLREKALRISCCEVFSRQMSLRHIWQLGIRTQAVGAARVAEQEHVSPSRCLSRSS